MLSSGNQGERWFILYNFLIRNAGKDKPVTRAAIYKELESHGIKVTENTFYSDLNELSIPPFGLIIEYDFRRNGYILKNPPFEDYELRLMVDGIQSLRFVTQKTANEITEKIKNLASKSQRAALGREAFVSNRIRSQNEGVVQETEAIYAAISSNRKVSFRYFHREPTREKSKKYSRAGNIITVSPFATVWDSGNYYLYAYDSEKKNFRTYRIDRMEKISLSDEKREGIEEYRRKELTNRAAAIFDMYSGQRENVTFVCHNTIADSMIDRFGEHISIYPKDKTHFTFNAAVELSPPFYAWVATFGRRIKITAPESAVNGMKDFLNKSMDMYREKTEE